MRKDASTDLARRVAEKLSKPNPNEPDPREAFLPKWVQSTLADLRRQTSRLWSEVNALQERREPEPGEFFRHSEGRESPLMDCIALPGLFMPGYHFGRADVNGGKRDRIQFTPREGWLDVYAVEGRISVQPGASNVIRVRPDIR